jgi:hypothetical protein
MPSNYRRFLVQNRVQFTYRDRKASLNVLPPLCQRWRVKRHRILARAFHNRLSLRFSQR